MRTCWLRTVLGSLAIAGAVANPSFADGALYDPAPPPNSAFLRIMSAAPAAVADGKIGGNPISLGEANVSDFVVVPGGKSAVEAGGKSGEVDCPSGKYCSVVFDLAGSSSPALIVDEVLDNPAKSGLHFYNLTDQPALTLFAPDQGVALFEGVPTGGMKFRQVGAVTVNLSVKSGDSEVAKIEGAALKRRTGHSVIVRGASGSITAAIIENTVAK
jgi:alginate O-acetyltransferase complex protein AlgF